ncbi:replication restart DNA helicase PriA [Leptothoe kymatousa]|uniref:replication restart DNA helicase PriA n=1 Tax=Leptothoe kymatousa TaxID=2651727 RepID=UPI001FE9B5A7
MSTTIQSIHCPNCGKAAERHYLNSQQLTRTQCSSCDYLMIVCQRTGKVIEAYAPGFASVFAS